MSDLNLASGTIQIIEYGDPIIATDTGLTIIEVPAGKTLAEIKVWGSAGGGGGRSESAVAKGGDGGGGGFRHVRNVPVIPGENIVLVIGVGGAGGIGSSTVGV